MTSSTKGRKPLIKVGVDIIPVKKHEVDKFWGLCQFMIIEALKYNGSKMTAPQLKEDIEEGFYQLYIIFGSEDGIENKVFGVLVTRVTDHPQLRQCEVEILTGKKRELWEDKIITLLEQIAVINDCHRISIIGRPGWKKLGDKYGYRVKNYEFVKEML